MRYNEIWRKGWDIPRQPIKSFYFNALAGYERHFCSAKL